MAPSAPMQEFRSRPIAWSPGRITDPDGVPMANTAVEILMKRPAQPPTAQRASFGATVRVGDIEVSRQTGGTTNDKGDFRIGRLQPERIFWLSIKRTAVAR